MSYLTHPCTECGCGLEKRGGGRAPSGSSVCSCGHAICRPGPPELRKTYDVAGQPVEAITPPGGTTGFGFTTCTCKACTALHAELAPA